jgi:subtilisin family serine protease
VAAMFLLAILAAAPPARAQNEKLDEWLQLVLDQESIDDLAAFDEFMDIELEPGASPGGFDDTARLGILIQVKPGTQIQDLESGCNCELEIGAAWDGSFEVIPATIPYTVIGSASANRQPSQPLMALAALDAVVYVSASLRTELGNDIGSNNTVTTDPDGSPIFLGANGQVLHQVDVDGRGVVVGIVDSGIDWRHADFRDPANQCTRIAYLWDQTDFAGRCANPAPTTVACNPGAAGNAHCAIQRVCTPPPGGVVTPCLAGPGGNFFCNNLQAGSQCLAAAGATCVANNGVLPAGFTKGTEWTAADIDSANGVLPACGGGPAPAGVPVREQDTDGHGTHVAGTAAGNGSASGGGAPFPFEGMAPQTSLIVVKTAGNQNDAISGMRYVFNRAATLGVPAVINYSSGGQWGPHDGTSTFERGISQLAAAGNLIVTIAHNQATVTQHADNRHRPMIGLNPPKQRLTVEIPAVLNPPALRAERLEIWYDLRDRYRVTVSGPGGGGTPSVTVAAGNSGLSAVVAGRQVDVSNATLNFTNPPLGAAGMAIVFLGVGNQIAGTWTVDLEQTTAAGNGIWDAWLSIGTAQFPVPGAANDGRPTNTIRVTEPGNAARVITVASHNTRNIAGAGIETLGAISPFSNPGPTRDGRLRPHLSAPGRFIASSCSADAGGCGNPDATHRFDAGTSMAAPHVTGCLALMLQQNRYLAPDDALARLLAMVRTDARSSQVRVDTNANGRWDPPADRLAAAGHWNPDFGWGKLNCALKAPDDELGTTGHPASNGAFFSVGPMTAGAAGAVRVDPDPAHIFVGRNQTNGLAIHKAVLGLGANDNIDAFSFRTDPRTLVPAPRVNGVEFAVRGGVVGLPGTELNQLAADAESHIWLAQWFLVPPLPFAGTNSLLFRDIWIGLTSTTPDKLDGVVLENPAVAVAVDVNNVTSFPPVAAFPIRNPRPGGIGFTTYFSLAAGSPTLLALPARPSDILSSNGSGPPVVAFSGGADLKLGTPGVPGCVPPNCDDVDAFFVDRVGNLRFSLAAGSPTLAQINARPGDILQPGKTAPVVFLPAGSLGLAAANTDDLNGLDIEACQFAASTRMALKNGMDVLPGANLTVAAPTGVMRIGKNVLGADASQVAAKTVRVNTDTSLANVRADNFTMRARSSVRGVQLAAPALPLPFDSYARRGTNRNRGANVVVPAGGSTTLASGIYGDVKVSTGGSLQLNGRYQFNDLTVGKNARVVFTGTDQSWVSVLKLKMLPNGTLGPYPAGACSSTPAPLIEVARRAPVVFKGDVSAQLVAPFAPVRIIRNRNFLGSIMARTITADPLSTLGCECHTEP